MCCIPKREHTVYFSMISDYNSDYRKYHNSHPPILNVIIVGINLRQFASSLPSMHSGMKSQILVGLTISSPSSHKNEA